MQPKLKVLQVIPKLGYGGAETGCYDIAHYLPENNVGSYLITSGGELLQYIDRKKVKVIRLPVQSKNPLLILINSIIISAIILINGINIVHARSRAPAWSCFFSCIITRTKFVTTFHGVYNFSNNIKKFEENILEIDFNVSIAFLSLGAIIPTVTQSALEILVSISSNIFFTWLLLNRGAVLSLFKSSNFFISI